MIKHFFASSIIALMILSTFVMAAGSSTGNAQNNNVIANATPNCQIGTPGCRDRNGVQVNGVYRMCESKITLAERIKCRFDNKDILRQGKDYLLNATEEACRGHANATISACENLYKNSAKCYNQADAVAKKRCFLKESGININAQGTFRAAPDETKRNYVVLLLYELQEKIEAKQEQGKITTDQATSLVTKIVEIKKLILSGAKRSDIVPKIQEFKKEFREVMNSSEVSQ